MTAILSSIVLPYIISITLTSAKFDYKKFLPTDEGYDLDVVGSCVNVTVDRLFNNGNRIIVVSNGNTGLEDTVMKSLMSKEAAVIADRPIFVKRDRVPSFVVIIEHGRLSNTRDVLLVENPTLRTSEYLFVTMADREEILLFAGDLWLAGFRDVAFLMFNGASSWTIVRPSTKGMKIILRSVGHCGSSRNNVDQIQPFSSDLYRFCPERGCTLMFGSVTDATVNFWRSEDQLRLKKNASYATLGGMLLKRFGLYYNITIDKSVGRDLNWTEASAKLVNGDADIVTGLMPVDPKILDSLEIICWYLYRDMVFAAEVRLMTLGNDVLKLLMPFHYLVWLCMVILLILYISLVHILRQLWKMGLIKERVTLIQIYAIMVGQGVTFPKNFGLRLVLLLWMLFSVYLGISYTSTFTSSLAQVETEDLLENFKEIRDSGRTVGGPAIIGSYLNDSFDPVVEDVYKRYVIMTPEETLNGIFTNSNVAAVQQFTVDRLNWANRANRSQRIYTLPEPVIRFPVFFFARRRHPFRNPLRHLVTMYRETGLVRKMKTTYLIDENKQIALRQSSDEILTMKHLRAIFELFYISQTIAALVFLVEVIRIYALKRSK